MHGWLCVCDLCMVDCASVCVTCAWLVVIVCDLCMVGCVASEEG